MRHLHSLVDTVHSIGDMVDVLQTKKLIGFDIETTGLEWWNVSEKIVGMGFGYIAKDHIRTYYMPLNHTMQPCFNELKGFTMVHPILENKTIAKVGANSRFDVAFLVEQGLVVNNVHDVQIMARLVRSDFQRVGLKHLCKKEFGIEHEQQKVLKKWAREHGVRMTDKEIEPGAMAKCDPHVVGRYCAEDVYWTLMLCKLYAREIDKDPKLISLYKTVEQPLIKATMSMEHTGIVIDISYLESCKERLSTLYDELETSIYDLAGRKFNLDSHVEMKEILLEHGLKPEMRRRKRGDETIETPSMDKKVIEKAKHLPIVQAILKFRAVTKLLNTYVKPMLITQDGIIHASIIQETARTGRLSALRPNLMNLPKTENLGDSEIDQIKKANSIRRAIVPKAILLPGRTKLWAMLLIIDLCLEEDTEIITEFGPMTIKQVAEQKPGVLSCSSEKELRFNKVTDGICTGRSKVYRIELEDGSFVEATGEHKWMRLDGSICKTKELKLGDRLAHVKSFAGNKRNYPRWWIYSSRNYFSCHRLVAAYKFGDRPRGYHTDHIDGNPTNWRSDNLRYLPAHINCGQGAGRWWGRVSERARFKRNLQLITGIKLNRRSYRGEGNTRAILTEDDVRYIRANYRCRVRGLVAKLAARYGVAEITIRKIVQGKNWAHLHNPCPKNSNHRVKSIRCVGEKTTYQITVERDHNYVLKNGLVSQNCQIEYKLLAHFSGDKTLIKLFHDGIDFHSYVASQLFSVPIEKLTKQQRSIGKKFNFAQLYGSGLEHLAVQCEVSIETTRALIEEYAKRFPAIIDFKYGMQRLCSRVGGVRNPFGRFRILPSKLSYRAVNTLIQGTASDLFKLSILRVTKILEIKRSKLLFPVHDELVINWVLSDGNIISPIINAMTKFEIKGKPIFKVPITVDVSVCPRNYEEKEKLDPMHMAQADMDVLEQKYYRRDRIEPCKLHETDFFEK